MHEKVARLTSDMERVQALVEEKSAAIESMEHNLHAADVRCSALQVM
jgi:hypothetical protein